MADLHRCMENLTVRVAATHTADGKYAFFDHKELGHELAEWARYAHDYNEAYMGLTMCPIEPGRYQFDAFVSSVMAVLPIIKPLPLSELEQPSAALIEQCAQATHVAWVNTNQFWCVHPPPCPPYEWWCFEVPNVYRIDDEDALKTCYEKLSEKQRRPFRSIAQGVMECYVMIMKAGVTGVRCDFYWNYAERLYGNRKKVKP